MSDEDNRDDNTVPAQTEPMALAIFEAEANERIRKVWHDGRWFYSVIDIIALLTESDRPGKYWADMKSRITDKGFVEASAKCRSLKVIATDGKLRETDSADFATVISLMYTLPSLHRRPGQTTTEPDISTGKCGIYAIVNTLTQDQYIGSSSDIPERFASHRGSLRRGKHHAVRLQAAWTSYGEEAFIFVVLENVAGIEQLEEVEQHYIDELRPAYNSAPLARNRLSLPPISEERVKQVLLYLYELQGTLTAMPLFCGLREAIKQDLIKPGPKFAMLVQAEVSGVETWAELGDFIQRYQQAC